MKIKNLTIPEHIRALFGNFPANVGDNLENLAIRVDELLNESHVGKHEVNTR